jgi:hypothetical protein
VTTADAMTTVDAVTTVSAVTTMSAVPAVPTVTTVAAVAMHGNSFFHTSISHVSPLFPQIGITNLVT